MHGSLWKLVKCDPYVDKGDAIDCLTEHTVKCALINLMLSVHALKTSLIVGNADLSIAGTNKSTGLQLKRPSNLTQRNKSFMPSLVTSQ